MLLWEHLFPFARGFMNSMGSIGFRLREERERLGLNQSDFAEKAGATRKSQFNYETDARRPDADYLAAIAAAGADVLYVLTGQRTSEAPIESALPDGDRVLLDNFHAAPAQVQAGIRTALGAFTAEAGKHKKAG